jgi:(S)-2-hydroxyglutarate dehydrogenase
MTRHDVVIVGGGIIGLATARQLLVARPGLDVVVLEAAPRVGAHQSSHNSGVLHAGVYYEPGSRKARWCVQGKAALERWCDEHGIPVHHVGKVVVATHDGELDRLADLERRARANGVPGLARLDAAGLKEIEPNVTGVAALHSPGTAVVDFGEVTRGLAAEVTARGGDIRLHAPVIDLRVTDAHAVAVTPADEVHADVIVTCAGLQSDRLAAMTGHLDGLAIVPFRGTWALLGGDAARLVRGNVYPVPDPAMPFLGVHLTPRPDGMVLVGPNAVLAGSRHGYRRGAVDPRDLLDVARHPGTWGLAARYGMAGARELWLDRVTRAQLAQVRRYLPDIEPADLQPGPSGVRAQLVDRAGRLVDDFVLGGGRRVVHVRNAPSPAATASLAIGAAIRDEVLARLG